MFNSLAPVNLSLAIELSEFNWEKHNKKNFFIIIYNKVTNMQTEIRRDVIVKLPE